MQGCTNKKRAYSKGVFDFFAIHVVRENAWFIVPLGDVLGQRWVSLYPHQKRGKFEIYRENWAFLG